jgi:hypothetical protein
MIMIIDMNYKLLVVNIRLIITYEKKRKKGRKKEEKFHHAMR